MFASFLLIGDSKLPEGVNVSMNVCLSLRDTTNFYQVWTGLCLNALHFHLSVVSCPSQEPSLHICKANQCWLAVFEEYSCIWQKHMCHKCCPFSPFYQQCIPFTFRGGLYFDQSSVTNNIRSCFLWSWACLVCGGKHASFHRASLCLKTPARLKQRGVCVKATHPHNQCLC